MRNRAFAFVAVAALSGSALSLIGAAVPASAATGAVSGVVFEDYDLDGVQDAGSNAVASSSAADVGVRNVAVTVTDSTGAVVGSTTTDATGAFSLPSVSAATTAVRVEVTPPAGWTTGPVGPDSGTTVQFLTLGDPAATDIGVGLTRAGDYGPDAGTSLQLLIPVQRAAVTTVGVDGFVNQATNPSLAAIPYSLRGEQAAQAVPEAYISQTGSIWGVAQLEQDYAFTSAFFKRHTAVGPTTQTDPGELGAIYLTDLAAAPNASPFVTIPNAGTNPRGDESLLTFQQWFNDNFASYHAVYKIGLGALAMAPDHRSLYVVNLNSRSLWQVPFARNGSGVPVAGTPIEHALPLGLPGATVGCPGGTDNVRPFGVNAQNGSLWITLTCTGPATGDLRGYVYRGTLAGAFDAAPALELPLSGFNRGVAWTGIPGVGNWQPWQPETNNTWPGTGDRAAKPQPLLSDVVFDSNGDMTIGIKDRFGDQSANLLGLPTPSSTITNGFPAGDTVRACLNPDGTAWVIESNRICGTRVGWAANNNQGYGGGEFYNDNYPAGVPGGAGHQQVHLGALLQVPGYLDLVTTSFDPGNDVRTMGHRFLSNLNGQLSPALATGWFQLINDANGVRDGGFGKAGGLGDITVLIDAAPVEIGNRVWIDADFDGVQDAGEAPVPGVTVRLYAADGTTVLGTTVTDAAGNYLFSSTTTPGLKAASNYTVRLDNPADFAAGGPLNGYVPTVTAAGPDRAVDSNGVPGPGGSVSAAVTTGPEGASDDHTIDFGFRRPPRTHACRGSGLRLGVITITVANEPIRPCVTADSTISAKMTYGSVPLPGAVGGLLGSLVPAGSLGFNVTGLQGRSYNRGDQMAADADVAQAQITLPGINLGIGTIHSEASATLQPGCTTAFDGFSRVGNITLNGLPLLAGTTNPVTIPLGIATLYVNQRVVVGDTITFRSIFLDLPGTALDLILGESIAGVSC